MIDKFAERGSRSLAVAYQVTGFWLKGHKGISGYKKNKIGKVELVGPRSRACHVLRFSVYFNWILDSGGNGCAIGLI